MKIGLILANNLWFSPYTSIYTKLFDEFNIDYDLIFWNRDGKPDEKGIQFKINTNSNLRPFKFIHYSQYVKFVKKIITLNNYDKLIIFGPQLGIFLSPYLSMKFKNKYIFDFRDLSIEQYGIFKIPFKMLLKNSYLNVVSSPGFIEYLPSNYEYIISHNLDIDLAKKSLHYESNHQFSNPIEILTIGGIRDFNSNIEIINSFANNNKYHLYFVGKGPATTKLIEFTRKNRIFNVDFHGYYNKSEESTFIRSCSFMNIFYPKINTHSSALSNRFYNSLIFRKPMIVTKNSIQGNLVHKYNLGLVIEDSSMIEFELNSYLNKFNIKDFDHNCKKLLLNFIEEYESLRKRILSFIEK